MTKRINTEVAIDTIHVGAVFIEVDCAVKEKLVEMRLQWIVHRKKRKFTRRVQTPLLFSQKIENLTDLPEIAQIASDPLYFCV